MNTNQKEISLRTVFNQLHERGQCSETFATLSELYFYFLPYRKLNCANEATKIFNWVEEAYSELLPNRFSHETIDYLSSCRIKIISILLEKFISNMEALAS